MLQLPRNTNTAPLSRRIRLVSVRGDAFRLCVNHFGRFPFAVGRTRVEINIMFGFTPRGLSGRRLLALSGAAVLVLAACGGGMGGGATSGTSGTTTPMSCGASSCGTSMLTMTDAKGDFLSYIVTLTSLQLQTAAGATVETLPVATKVDFSQLVDLSEVISAGQIPAAEYVSATLTIDYAGANITADDGTGTAVSLSPVDSNGNALTGSVAVSIQLDNANHLVITPGRTGRLAFDFNLAASNTVDLTDDTVTVSPTLVATVVPADNKQVRARGQLASVDASKDDFVLNVQPFYNQSGNGGQLTVDVTSTTTYQINGTAYVGDAGLTALAALPADTMTAAFGTLQTGTQTFTASAVLAGTSLQNPNRDQVFGTVIARSGNTLTVRGATLWDRNGDFNFDRHDLTVTIGNNTTVSEAGTTGSFTIADISVGQRIDAFGTLSQSGTDMSGGMTTTGTVSLDATAGAVRLDLTPAWGLVTFMGSGSITLNLQSMNGLPASALNFAGTGTSSANDANEAAYVVDTGTLSFTGLALNAPARVFGFVTPFGTAPPDFSARTLVNYSAVTEGLVIDWMRPGSAVAFTGLTATSTSLKLDLANVGMQHFVQIGPEELDLTSLSGTPSIVPASGNVVFSIGHRNHYRTENFNSFADFVSALNGEISGGALVVAVAAAGQFDNTTELFTASRAAVLLNQ